MKVIRDRDGGQEGETKIARLVLEVGGYPVVTTNHCHHVTNTTNTEDGKYSNPASLGFDLRGERMASNQSLVLQYLVILFFI